MKKVVLATMAVLVAVMFASVAVAATSTQCGSCAKPCNTCAKPKPCAPCAKPCNTCSTPCMPLPKVSVDWKWPTMSVEPCAPCAKPCAAPCLEYKRDVLGQRVPVQTIREGNDRNDTATNYEAAGISGQ